MFFPLVHSVTPPAKKILNPVVGLRFDPIRPKMTIGALDPNDYEVKLYR